MSSEFDKLVAKGYFLYSKINSYYDNINHCKRIQKMQSFFI